MTLGIVILWLKPRREYAQDPAIVDFYDIQMIQPY